MILALVLLGSEKKPETAKPKMAATIFPIFDIAKHVAGDKFDVVLIAPPGASPHTFEVTAEQIKNLQNSEIIFSIGYGLDDWMARVQSAVPEIPVKNVSANINLREFADSHDSEHGGIDPHYWLTIPNAQIITQNILKQLQEIDPTNSAYFQTMSDQYLSELDQTDREIRNLLKDIKNPQIIAMHEAWSYFAQQYGLELVATFEPFPGREPTPKYLAELSQTAEKYQIKVIFSEPQLSNEVLEPFIADLNLKLAVLDPVGGIGERDSYINTMLYNAKIIHDALK